MDMPRLHDWHARDAYQKYLARVGRMRWPLVASDFVSGVSRQVGFRIPRLGVVKQSEKINYFTERSVDQGRLRCDRSCRRAEGFRRRVAAWQAGHGGCTC